MLLGTQVNSKPRFLPSAGQEMSGPVNYVYMYIVLAVKMYIYLYNYICMF